MDLFKSLNSLLPTYETTLPFSKQQVTFTPFRVKDAKALALIIQEDNKKLALKNMVELIQNCSKGVVIDELCLADAEYLFLQIRSKSVDEILNLIFNDEKVQVNIADIKPRNAIFSETISISGKISIVLETPVIKDLLRLESFDRDEIGKACIQKVIDGNEIYRTNKFMTHEIKQLVENLPFSVMPKIDSFLKKQPELYTNLTVSNGTKEVSGLLNFFTYR